MNLTAGHGPAAPSRHRRADTGMTAPLVACSVALLAHVCRCAGSPANAATPQGPLGDRPNIVMMLTDDEDLLMSGFDALPRTRALLSSTLTRHTVNTPICCPSRATLLSGRFSHSNVAASKADADACMHMNITELQNPAWETRAFAPAVHTAGYTTGYFGKYLNIEPNASTICGYDGKFNVPPGWDRWFVMCGPSFFHQHWNDDGKPLFTGGAPSDYTTSQIGNKTVAWLQAVLDRNAATGTRTPFLAIMAPHAPHLPATPAPWYASTYGAEGLKAPRTRGYNFSGTTHHWEISSQPPLDQADVRAINAEFTDRQRSLLSVDDTVGAVADLLQAHGEWNNTLFLFTSDHGYSLGQLRVPTHKTQVYDTNTRVPMLLHLPGMPADARVSFDQLTAHVDVAPTFADAAGAQVPPYMDGRSFASLLATGVRKAQVAAAERANAMRIQSAGRRARGGELPLEGTPASASSALASQVAIASPAVPLVHVEVGERDDASWQATLVEYWSIHDQRVVRGHPTDSANNTHRALRIQNSTHNLLYAEFTDDRVDWHFDSIQFRELFDLTNDPDALYNVYNNSDTGGGRVVSVGGAPVDVQALKAMLAAAFACDGGVSCRAAGV